MNEYSEPALHITELGGELGISGSQSSDPRLCVTVISTTAKGTTAALKAATALAKDLAAKIVLLNVEVVPPRFQLNAPRVALDLTLKQQRSLLLRSSAKDEHVAIRICLCRDRDQCLLHVLRRRALVVIGGRRRWWSRGEEKLEHALRRLGHHVIFIDVEREKELLSQVTFSSSSDRSAGGSLHNQSADMDSFFGRGELR
jgi:hypothetical protein